MTSVVSDAFAKLKAAQREGCSSLAPVEAMTPPPAAADVFEDNTVRLPFLMTRAVKI